MLEISEGDTKFLYTMILRLPKDLGNIVPECHAQSVFAIFFCQVLMNSNATIITFYNA